MGTNERVLRRIERLLERADQADISGDWPEVKRLAEEILVIAPTNNEAIAYLRSANAELGQSTDSPPPPRDIDAGNDKTPAKKSALDKLHVSRFLAPVIAPEHLPEPSAKASKWSRKSKFVLAFITIVVLGVVLLGILMPEDFACHESDIGGPEYETVEAVYLSDDVVRQYDDPSRDSINYGRDNRFKFLLGMRLQGRDPDVFETWVVHHYLRDQNASIMIPVNILALVRSKIPDHWDGELIVSERNAADLTRCMEFAAKSAP